MRPADDFTPQQLVGKRVAFKEDAEHSGCWHFQVGLKTAVMLKLGQTLAQKAELMGPESPIPPELLEAEDDEPRLWVKVDPCRLFPRGCEAAVEKSCLQVLDA
jgi:hypothetical protein